MPPSKLEQQFDSLWSLLYPGVDLEAEVCLIPGRKYRFDYVHNGSKTALEINGGNFSRGRHTRGAALTKEYEKIILAAELGYITLCIDSSQINPEILEKLHNIIQLRLFGSVPNLLK